MRLSSCDVLGTLVSNEACVTEIEGGLMGSYCSTTTEYLCALRRRRRLGGFAGVEIPTVEKRNKLAICFR